MKGIRELMEVLTVSYDKEDPRGGSLPAIMNITKGWLDPEKIHGITSGSRVLSLGRITMSEERCPPQLRSPGGIATGDKFTLLHYPKGDVLVVGKPEELHQKIKEKLAEIVRLRS